MPDAVATQARLAELETERATGCLTIVSSTGGVGHVYLLMGRPFHADSPSGEGDGALADALSWPDATVSFDATARLPGKRTIQAQPAKAPITSHTADRLDTDPRVFAMSCASLGGGGLAIVVPIALILIGGTLHPRWATPAAIVCALLFGTVWMAGSIGFRIVFLQEGVKVSGGLPKAEIPRVVEAPAGVIGGEPELVVKMVTRCLAGKVGKCRLEFYPNGLQIRRDLDHTEPCWQFSYSDLAHAELIDVASTGKITAHMHYVRMIVNMPRMAFLFSGTWFPQGSAEAVVQRLAAHNVRTFTEELDT